MTDKILTIIVPSYNIAKYVESIVPHYIDDLLLSKISILFIDDGATDNTVFLLEKYSKKYPDSLHIVKKENGGHGSVINYGVNLVKTKYFKVIDGDDWVDKEELIKLCDYLDSCDDDIVVSNFIYEFNDRSSLSNGFDKRLDFSYKIHLHNVTYKTSLWIDNSIKVREKVFYEDSQYVLFPLEFAQSISYFDADVYHYRCDNPNQSVNPQQQLKHKDDYVLVARDLCDFYQRLKTDSKIDSATKGFVIDNVVRIVFGAYEICSSRGLPYKQSVSMCKDLDKIFKPYKDIFKLINRRYKKIRYLRLFNYFGLRLYLRS